MTRSDLNRELLLKALDDILIDIREDHDQCNNIRQELSRDCKHERTIGSSRTRGNGYGSLVSSNFILCQLCYAENHYGNWINAWNINRGDDD